jgi:hypothetical protein
MLAKFEYQNSMAQVAAPNMRLPMVNLLLLNLKDMESVLSNCKAMMVLLNYCDFIVECPYTTQTSHAVSLHLMCMNWNPWIYGVWVKMAPFARWIRTLLLTPAEARRMTSLLDGLSGVDNVPYSNRASVRRGIIFVHYAGHAEEINGSLTPCSVPSIASSRTAASLL